MTVKKDKIGDERDEKLIQPLAGDLVGGDHFGELIVSGRIALKWMLNSLCGLGLSGPG
jgi:hypothetical protein